MVRRYSLRRRPRRSIRRSRRMIRRVSRRNRASRNPLGSKYDSGYLAKCTQSIDVLSNGVGTQVIMVDWGTAPGIIANAFHLQTAPQFQILANSFREYRILGFKVKFNFG